MKVLGILLILFATIFYIGNKFLPENKKINALNDRKNYLMGLGLGFLLIFMSMSFFYADPGKQYFIVSPFGYQKCRNSEATSLFSFIQSARMAKYIDVKCL